MVHFALEIELFQLFLGVLRVLAFDARVPGEERQGQGGFDAFVVCHEAGDQLIPESRGGPVLDRVTGGLGGHVVLAAVEPDQFVTEEQGGLGAVNAPAHVLEGQTEFLRDAQQPFEMRRAETEHTAVDGAFGGDQLRIAVTLGLGIVDGCTVVCGRVEYHADFVGEDFLGCAHALQGVGIEGFLQLRYQELIGEHRELHDEVHDLLMAFVAMLEPCRVGVVGDDGVAQQLGVDAGLKGEKAPPRFDAVALTAISNSAQADLGEPVERIVAGEAVQLRVGGDAHG